MLFNSYEFVFGFFPISVIAFWLLRPLGSGVQRAMLFLASLGFYAWWSVAFVPVLLSSIIVNYLLGRAIDAFLLRQYERMATLLLSIGVLANLCAIGIFKYALFFVVNINALLGTNISIGQIILPLGISFFTFEQISFLVDVRRGRTHPADLLRYCLFVSFFPRLVAGPILRYSEIVPQFTESAGRGIYEQITIGMTIFFIGLVKKSVLADGIAPFVSPIFRAASNHEPIDLFVGWGGALAYTCQLYFDFSGYSDMAIGAARCFGIRFPQNFNSPYKSSNIVEFWRRWHITLSRFLRDYLYVELGGNRHGATRRYLNLMITMLLGGLWHGANWTYVAWGALHGAYLIVNHGWIAIADRSQTLGAIRRTKFAAVVGTLLTFIGVVIAWVLFRASDFSTALNILEGMAGQHGAVIPSGLAFAVKPISTIITALGITFADTSGGELIGTYLWVAVLSGIMFALPNTQELLARYSPILETPSARRPDGTGTPEPWSSHLTWSPSRRWAVAIATLTFLGILSITRVSEFLYCNSERRHMQSNAFAIWFVGTLLALATLTVLVTVGVDPYRMYGTPVIPGWTELKPRVYQQTGIAKTNQLERVKPNTILLGNSRVEIGLDPESPYWPNELRPVFNAAESGRGLDIAVGMLKDAVALHRPKLVLVGLDISDFLGKPDPTAPAGPRGADAARLLVDGRGLTNDDRPLQIWRDRLTTTLTIDALLDSLATLIDQDPATSVTMTPYGFNPLNEYRVFVQRIGYAGIFGQKNAIYDREYRRYQIPDFPDPLQYTSFRSLEEIIRITEDHHIPLILFVNPYHVDYLEMLRHVGLWGTFENWKRTLVRVTDDAQRSASLQLFDFSGYDPFTTETVPVPGDTRTEMRYYWEAGHYKRALGDELLSAIFAGKPAAFGRRLTLVNIEAVLAEIRQDRATAMLNARDKHAPQNADQNLMGSD